MPLLKLLPHQVKYAYNYKDKELVVHEGGTGKTICACVWLKDSRDAYALVVCPKRVLEKWRQTLTNWGASATVVSKEEFKKLPPARWTALVIDEADEFASPLFTKARSQLSTALYTLVQKYDCPILLLTATPIRSNPWNLHTLLCFRGHYIDWRRWRERFFSLQKLPYLPRPAWIPKPNWRQEMRPLLEKYADIVLLKDCVDYLPPVTETTVLTPPKIKFKGSHELTPTAQFVEEHKYEQSEKAAKILEIGQEYRKVLVVAYYVEQVEALKKELSKDRETFMVHGGVKDQEAILAVAQASDECYLIVQASLGAGFDADTFSCVVFTSMSYKVRDFVQMKYRVRRIHNLHPVQYYYLLGGRCDKAVKKTIDLGKEFVPSEWQQNDAS